MKIGVSPLERAFQLAGSGAVANVAEIKTAMKAEGYRLDDLQGNALFKQLRGIIKTAREATAQTGAAPAAGEEENP